MKVLKQSNQFWKKNPGKFRPRTNFFEVKAKEQTNFKPKVKSTSTATSSSFGNCKPSMEEWSFWHPNAKSAPSACHIHACGKWWHTSGKLNYQYGGAENQITKIPSVDVNAKRWQWMNGHFHFRLALNRCANRLNLWKASRWRWLPRRGTPLIRTSQQRSISAFLNSSRVSYSP